MRELTLASPIDHPGSTAITLVSDELRRVRSQHGDSAVFGGSYGWASAGRFHHAQGQLHRFLALGGGYTWMLQRLLGPQAAAAPGTRAGQPSASAIGSRMSGGLACAMVDPSQNVTIECTIDCG